MLLGYGLISLPHHDAPRHRAVGDLQLCSHQELRRQNVADIFQILHFRQRILRLYSDPTISSFQPNLPPLHLLQPFVYFQTVQLIV